MNHGQDSLFEFDTRHSTQPAEGNLGDSGDTGEFGGTGRVQLPRWVLFWDTHGGVAAALMIPLVLFFWCFKLPLKKKKAVVSTSETVWQPLLHTLLKKCHKEFHLNSAILLWVFIACLLHNVSNNSTPTPPKNQNTQTDAGRHIELHSVTFQRSWIEVLLHLHIDDPQTYYWSCKPIIWKESVGSAQTDFHGYRLRSLSIPAILHSFIMQVHL